MRQIDLAHVLAPCLTKREFLAAYALSWVSHAFTCYGAESLTDIESETVFGSLGQEILHGIRILHRAGHRFQNLTLDENDCPRLNDEHEINQGNLTFVAALATGIRFDYLRAVEAAIELANEEGLQLDPRPLKQARQELVETIAEWKKDMPPEQARQIIEERQKRMKHAAQLLDTPTRQAVN